ncbi:MAG: hypothetical protein ACYTGH_14065 [Planctomycetota bacterium]|jgi:hypothetical protein
MLTALQTLPRSTRLLLLLALPTLLAFPVLVWKEMEKLNLPSTLPLSREARRDFYIRHAMPVIPEDYHPILDALRPYLNASDQPKDYAIVVRPDINPTLSHILYGYTVYRFTPSRLVHSPDGADLVLYYQCPPPAPGAKPLPTFKNLPPSYISLTTGDQP